MTTQPGALRLARKFEEVGFVGDHKFAQDKWCREAAVELRRLHSENQDLRTRHYCNTAEVEALQNRVQELGEMARENRSKRVIELERRIAEMEEQMAAIGAGGVEPLRRRAVPETRIVRVKDGSILSVEKIDQKTGKTLMIAAAPQQPTVNQQLTVPTFTAAAQHKLIALLSQGYQVTGYSIERADIADWSPQRGFITYGGIVGWWRPHTADADQPQEAEHHGQPS